VKLRELRDLGEAELRHRATELTDELFHLRLRRATSQLPNPMKMRETKRELARVLTLLGQRTTGAGTGRSEARR
jgi:large subunit ribosomal protein L29